MNLSTQQRDPRKDRKNLSNYALSELGIKDENLGFCSTLEDLRKTTPNIVIGKCLKDVKFSQNNFTKRLQSLRKKSNYVMSIGVYQMLFYDQRMHWEILKPSNVKFKNVYRPYTGQDLSNKNLLVMRTGGIGDLLFIQPNLSFLKENYPTCKIVFACGPQYQSMVKTWDCIDEVIDLPIHLEDLIRTQYHAIFEGVIERCREAEKVCSYNLFTRWLGLDLPDELLIPKQKVDEKSLEKCKEILKNWNLEEKSFTTIQMRASSPIRNPRPKVWINLIKRLLTEGFKIVLTDSPQNSDDIDSFIKELDSKDVFNFCKYSEEISDTISMVSLSKLVIGTDSSLLHIAASLNIPLFGIYGAFQGELRLSTYKNADWINCKSQCSPCHRHGLDPCPYSFEGFASCYDNLDIDLAIEKIKKLLENKEEG